MDTLLSAINSIVVFIGALCATFLACFKVYEIFKSIPLFVYGYYKLPEDDKTAPLLMLNIELLKDVSVIIEKIEVSGFKLSCPQIAQVNTSLGLDIKLFAKKDLPPFHSPYIFNFPVPKKITTIAFCFDKINPCNIKRNSVPYEAIIHYRTSSPFSCSRKLVIYIGDIDLPRASDPYATAVSKALRIEQHYDR